MIQQHSKQADAGRASPAPSEQPLKLTMASLISESDFTLWTRTSHQTLITLPVRETKRVWRAIKRLLVAVFCLHVQPEQQPAGFPKRDLGTEQEQDSGRLASGQQRSRFWSWSPPSEGHSWAPGSSRTTDVCLEPPPRAKDTGTCP